MKFSIPEHIISSPYSDELMIYDSILNKYYLIKGVGKEVLTLMNEGKSVAEICSHLTTIYKDETTIEKQVLDFVSSMQEKQIILRE